MKANSLNHGLHRRAIIIYNATDLIDMSITYAQLFLPPIIQEIVTAEEDLARVIEVALRQSANH